MSWLNFESITVFRSNLFFRFSKPRVLMRVCWLACDAFLTKLDCKKVFQNLVYNTRRPFKIFARIFDSLGCLNLFKITLILNCWPYYIIYFQLLKTILTLIRGNTTKSLYPFVESLSKRIIYPSVGS